MVKKYDIRFIRRLCEIFLVIAFLVGLSYSPNAFSQEGSFTVHIKQFELSKKHTAKDVLQHVIKLEEVDEEEHDPVFTLCKRQDRQCFAQANIWSIPRQCVCSNSSDIPIFILFCKLKIPS
jgi:hypothetical protein